MWTWHGPTTGWQHSRSSGWMVYPAARSPSSLVGFRTRQMVDATPSSVRCIASDSLDELRHQCLLVPCSGRLRLDPCGLRKPCRRKPSPLRRKSLLPKCGSRNLGRRQCLRSAATCASGPSETPSPLTSPSAEGAREKRGPTAVSTRRTLTASRRRSVRRAKSGTTRSTSTSETKKGSRECARDPQSFTLAQSRVRQSLYSSEDRPDLLVHLQTRVRGGYRSVCSTPRSFSCRVSRRYEFPHFPLLQGR